MVGIKCSGKTIVATHTFNPKLTPKPQASSSAAVIRAGDPNLKVSTAVVKCETSVRKPIGVQQPAPQVGDGSEFPLVVGISAEKVEAARREKTKQAPKMKTGVDVNSNAAFPALGSSGKPAAPSTLKFANATLRIVSAPQHKRVTALKGIR